MNNNLEKVKLLVRNCVSINYVTKDGFTILMLAIKNNDLEIVKYLIDNNANVYQVNEYGHNALILAVWNNNLEVFNFLMENTNDILDEEILEQDKNELPTYESMLKEDKDKLPTYEEVMKFQQEINNSDYFKDEIDWQKQLSMIKNI
ncbi:ankyrin repeat domain-containing protein [Spiroplasma endosymbiont of Notiophilus biguttatus]|uniref:ankyrin repeat domain-containing protein n=1 Tax=Spiroplasma endosymbiont of Notiophilus biguttatus TaxID=3066285 RepID=UPI00313D9112